MFDQRAATMAPNKWIEMLDVVRADTLQHALDALDQGVLVVAGDLRLVAANARGRALLQQSTALQVIQGFVAASGACRGAFEGALYRVAQGGHPESCALSKAPVDAIGTISRLPANTPNHSGTNLPHCLVVITTPGRQRIASVQQLMDVYALTPAEARLAHTLLRGGTVKGFQQEQGVREPTVRSQLKSLLHKVGVSRQQELVVRLACLPSARDAG